MSPLYLLPVISRRTQLPCWMVKQSYGEEVWRYAFVGSQNDVIRECLSAVITTQNGDILLCLISIASQRGDIKGQPFR